MELGPVAYIRKNLRAPMNQTFKFKLFNSNEWKRGLIADISKTGMGARILDVKESEKLKITERMLVRFKDLNGQIITKWAEVRWLKDSPYSYTAGLKFSA
jgi:c-di-GMP-binding flagellar brake protein YcgR